MAKLFLSERISKLNGVIDSKIPYIIQRDKNGGFYTRRIYPYAGGFDASHWQLFKDLLLLKNSHLYLDDFEITTDELAEALSERFACPFLPSQIKKWVGRDKVDAELFEAFDAWIKERWGGSAGFGAKWATAYARAHTKDKADDI